VILFFSIIDLAQPERLRKNKPFWPLINHNLDQEIHCFVVGNYFTGLMQ